MLLSGSCKSWYFVYYFAAAQTHLWQAKAMSAFLSGEMKDTVQMHPVGAYGLYLFSSDCVLTWLHVLPVLERFFSRKERQTLFRSWAGSAGMWLKACIFFFPSLSNDLAEMNRVVTLSGAMHLMPQTTIVTLLTVMENLSHSGITSTLMTTTLETWLPKTRAIGFWGILPSPSKLGQKIFWGGMIDLEVLENVGNQLFQWNRTRPRKT